MLSDVENISIIKEKKELTDQIEKIKKSRVILCKLEKKIIKVTEVLEKIGSIVNAEELLFLVQITFKLKNVLDNSEDFRILHENLENFQDLIEEN